MVRSAHVPSMSDRSPLTEPMAFQPSPCSLQEVAAVHAYAQMLANSYGHATTGAPNFGYDTLSGSTNYSAMFASSMPNQWATPSMTSPTVAGSVARTGGANHTGGFGGLCNGLGHAESFQNSKEQPAVLHKELSHSCGKVDKHNAGDMRELNTEAKNDQPDRVPQKITTKADDPNANARAALLWQLQRQFGEECSGQVLTVWPVNPCDLDSAEILWDHYLQYGPVARVLVAHSDDVVANDKWSSCTAGVAAVLMVNSSDVDRIVAFGGSQQVRGNCVSVAKMEGSQNGSIVPFDCCGTVELIASQLRLNATAARALSDLAIGAVPTSSRSEASAIADIDGQRVDVSGDREPPSSSPETVEGIRPAQVGRDNQLASITSTGSPGPSP